MAVSENEKDRDNWVRLTLRLPPDLHELITENAGPLSLNAAIIKLLEDALNMESELRSKIEAVDDIIEQHEEAARATNDLIEQIGDIVRMSVREEIESALARKRSK